MSLKKVKVFLGGYINCPNAQNVNCDNIAKYLDKDRFEVHTLYMLRPPIDRNAYKKQGIRLHRNISRQPLSKWLKMFTMWRTNCHIYYLPKREIADRRFSELLVNKKRKMFIASIESVLTEEFSRQPERKTYYLENMDASFAISNCIADSVKQCWNVQMEVLPLGVAKLPYKAEEKQEITRVIWVGNVKANKRPQYLIEIAKKFPQLQFTMVGDGDMDGQIRKMISEYGMTNVTLTGRIPNQQVYEKMQESDLLLMTSEFEGLPKVIQEAAQCGLPSIYMAENYKVDFLQNGLNGYEAYSLREMEDKLSYLLDNPEKYRKMSQKATEIIQSYTWEKLIPKYEEYFLRKLEEKRKKRETRKKGGVGNG